MNLLMNYKAKRKLLIRDGNISKAKKLTEVINILEDNNYINRMYHFGMVSEIPKKRRRKTWTFRLRGEKR